jgi:hypothetical protein
MRAQFMVPWLRWFGAKRTGERPVEQPRDTALAAPRRAQLAAEYRPLHKYLDERFADNVVLTFGQIEDLLGCRLPDLARSQVDWWAEADESGTPTMQSRSWSQAGRTATANIQAEIVRFERSVAET